MISRIVKARNGGGDRHVNSGETQIRDDCRAVGLVIRNGIDLSSPWRRYNNWQYAIWGKNSNNQFNFELKIRRSPGCELN